MSDITVKNINGEVALNGTVPNFPQYLEAAAAARRVSGVKDVHNHLEVVLPPGDYRDDVTLTTMANNALTLNVAVPDGVEAMAKNGNLTLTGTVSYGAERTAAEDAVAGPVITKPGHRPQNPVRTRARGRALPGRSGYAPAARRCWLRARTQRAAHAGGRHGTSRRNRQVVP